MDNESNHKSDPVGNIRVGDISNASSVAIGHGASASVTQGIWGKDTAQIFQTLMQKTNELPDGPSKIVAQQAIAGLEQEVNKGEAAQEHKLAEWFNFLAQAAPDVWDVAVATFANPVAGVARIVQLVAKKAKEEKEAKK
jgi:hypothetical protein